jgi:hypothetical protein
MDEQPDERVCYRIVVRGRLGEHLADAFGPLEIDSGSGQTALTGTFADQAQLHGLLDRLRDLGIYLISLNLVDPGSAPRG